MSIKKFMMPVDYTGELTSNRVTGEIHELEGSLNKLLVPYNGFFYTHNLRLYDDKHQPLTPGDDYECIYSNPTVQMHTPGLEVCGAIVIKPHVKTNTAAVSCNYVGGSWANYTKAIEEALIALDLDKRSIDFGSLTNMPEYFTAGAHIEDVGNVYGFEYLITAINRIKDTMVKLNSAESDLIVGLLDDLVSDVNRMYDEHAKDPKAHGTTAADVGAYDKSEVDTIAQQLASSVDLIRQQIDGIIESGDIATETVAGLTQRFNTMQRRMTIVDNIAKNALRRLAVADSGPSESDELTIKSLVVKKTATILGALTAPLASFDIINVSNSVNAFAGAFQAITCYGNINTNSITTNALTSQGDSNLIDVFCRLLEASSKVKAPMVEATNATVGNNLNVGGNSNVTYDLSVGRNHNVAGTSTAAAQNVTGTSTVATQVVTGGSTVRGTGRVDGDFTVGGNTSFSRDLYLGGNANANDVYIRSDIKLKKHVIPLVKCLAHVLKLNPVEYDKMQSLTDDELMHEFGLIANEAAEVSEHLVTKTENGLLSIRIYGVVALLVGAVQEMYSTVTAQEEAMLKVVEYIKSQGGDIEELLVILGMTDKENEVS